MRLANPFATVLPMLTSASRYVYFSVEICFVGGTKQSPQQFNCRPDKSGHRIVAEGLAESRRLPDGVRTKQRPTRQCHRGQGVLERTHGS